MTQSLPKLDNTMDAAARFLCLHSVLSPPLTPDALSRTTLAFPTSVTYGTSGKLPRRALDELAFCRQ